MFHTNYVIVRGTFYAIPHVYHSDVVKRVSAQTILDEENFENVLSFAVF